MRVPPASRNRESCSAASCSSVSRPQVIVPRATDDTSSPLRPALRSSMAARVPAVRGGEENVGWSLVTWWEAIILGVVQGLTEFLPISSSAHLRIVGDLLPGGGDPGAAFTAITQLGTETAVLLYFRRDIWRIVRAWFGALPVGPWRGTVARDDPDARMGWYIIIGSVPIVVFGLLFQDAIETSLRHLYITATMLAAFAVVLAVADRWGRKRRALRELALRGRPLLLPPRRPGGLRLRLLPAPQGRPDAGCPRCGGDGDRDARRVRRRLPRHHRLPQDRVDVLLHAVRRLPHRPRGPRRPRGGRRPARPGGGRGDLPGAVVGSVSAGRE